MAKIEKKSGPEKPVWMEDRAQLLSCQQAQALVAKSWQEELDEVESDSMAGHLFQCPNCSAIFQVIITGSQS